MNIRNAIMEDAEVIAYLHIEAWRQGYKGILPDEYLNSLSVIERTKQWQEILTQKNSGVNLVIEINNKVLGFCVYGPTRDEDLSNLNVGELVALNIIPDSWRLGLGAKLVNYVVQAARLNNWNALYLWVISENNRARKLYESIGFEGDGSERIDSNLTGCQLHEIRYVKRFTY